MVTDDRKTEKADCNRCGFVFLREPEAKKTMCYGCWLDYCEESGQKEKKDLKRLRAWWKFVGQPALKHLQPQGADVLLMNQRRHLREISNGEF